MSGMWLIWFLVSAALASQKIKRLVFRDFITEGAVSFAQMLQSAVSMSLSVHLNGEMHPTVIARSNYTHKTAIRDTVHAGLTENEY